ncbi:MAG: hypothetical protein H7251_10650 [Acetobacteraceae bacterium]|nr:hypothetical protein [Acetobacteraceae bacterium]
MRALKILTVVMGVMIIVGVVALGVVMTQRLGGSGAASAVSATLDEPTGTIIAGIAATADRIAIQLRGGGPDRVVLIDPKTGKPVGAVKLAH